MSYRIIYKWWLYGVYKKYSDGREILVEWFPSRKQAEEFIESDKERFD